MKNLQPSASRAFIRQGSGLCLNLLNPSPDAWTDEDLAIGLSRTFRWGAHSVWPSRPLTVAQHCLTVAVLAARSDSVLSDAQMLREIHHDSEESLLGGIDFLTPLKPYLGPGFQELTSKLKAAVFLRYALPAWTRTEHQAHKRADVLAAASEAVHVAGWGLSEVRDILEIDVTPLLVDPLAAIYGGNPWEPWPAELAAARFLRAIQHKPERDRLRPKA